MIELGIHASGPVPAHGVKSSYLGCIVCLQQLQVSRVCNGVIDRPASLAGRRVLSPLLVPGRGRMHTDARLHPQSGASILIAVMLRYQQHCG